MSSSDVIFVQHGGGVLRAHFTRQHAARPEKLLPIVKWERPKTITELRGFGIDSRLRPMRRSANQQAQGGKRGREERFHCGGRMGRAECGGAWIVEVASNEGFGIVPT